VGEAEAVAGLEPAMIPSASFRGAVHYDFHTPQ
jgi:hypothetical protein